MEYLPSRRRIRRMFPLLSLPTELIEYIFELAYEDEKPSGPLCRPLLPIYLISLHRRITVSNHVELERFMQAVAVNPAGGSLVKDLTLAFRPFRDVFSPDSADTFSSLLDRLRHLRSLACLHLRPHLQQALFLHLRQNPLPLLRTFAFAVAPPNHSQISSGHPDEAELLEVLHMSPRLTTLELNIDYLRDEILSASAASTTNSIKSLTLTGWLFDSQRTLPLQDCFPVLVELRLTDRSSIPDFETILQGAPAGIRRLSLRTTQPSYGDELSLDDVLPRFGQLEHLELCDGSFTPEHLLPVLRSFPSLRSLIIGPGTPVTDALLLSIVESPTQLPSLRTLTLDYVKNIRGRTFESAGRALSEDADETEGHVWPGWVEPEWNYFCTPSGLSAVISAAKTCGITLEGTALGAETWEDDYEDEREVCTMQYCYEINDFEEAEAKYGENEVTFWLEVNEEKTEEVLETEGGRQKDSDASEDESGAAWSNGEWGISGMYCDEWK